MDTIRLVKRIWNLAFTIAQICLSVIGASANQFVSMYVLMSGSKPLEGFPLLGPSPFTI
jgi:hypothetical protein